MAQGIRNSGNCAVPTCVRLNFQREWCRPHYMRWYRHGDPEAGRWSSAMGARPLCSVEGCSEPYLAKGLCDRHYQTQSRNGSPTALAYEWADPTPCKVCGDPPGGRFRQFCSYACWNAYRAYGDDILTATDCTRCGVRIDFLGWSPTGKRTYRMRSYCPKCSRRYTRWGMTVGELAARDGSACRLCGEQIDLALRRNEPGGFMCASVDHITPRSAGGTDDPTNLQLAHLLCNVRKGGVSRMP